ncbi:MAG: hypothetical protein EXS00_04130 [Phycisphaerales bacterium]|nr:hypothetical protein [Phycisphaerales bacterium]
MAKAYTPGLKVTASARYQARRVLPISGEVLVRRGDIVEARTSVARTFLEGDATPMKVANMLGCNPKELPSLMLVAIGSAVREGDTIARSKGIFGMMKTEVKCTSSGVIESVSDTTGMVIVRGAQIPVEVRAYIDGIVAEVLAGEGVVVENTVALVQGIFGIGGETAGILRCVCSSPVEPLEESHITSVHQGAIVVGGARASAAAIRKARAVGAVAIISGGIDDQDLRDFLGYDLGVAITGSEKTGLTVIVTEGFGDIAMATRTFELLRSHEGHCASVNGATQIRAGVMRPEVVVPLSAKPALSTTTSEAIVGSATAGYLEIGTFVRVIRDPYFGLLGSVAALPEQPAVLDSGSKARVLEVKLEDGRVVTVPRANVELIES